MYTVQCTHSRSRLEAEETAGSADEFCDSNIRRWWQADVSYKLVTKNAFSNATLVCLRRRALYEELTASHTDGTPWESSGDELYKCKRKLKLISNVHAFINTQCVLHIHLHIRLVGKHRWQQADESGISYFRIKDESDWRLLKTSLGLPYLEVQPDEE